MEEVPLSQLPDLLQSVQATWTRQRSEQHERTEKGSEDEDSLTELLTGDSGSNLSNEIELNIRAVLSFIWAQRETDSLSLRVVTDLFQSGKQGLEDKEKKEEESEGRALELLHCFLSVLKIEVRDTLRGRDEKRENDETERTRRRNLYRALQGVSSFALQWLKQEEEKRNRRFSRERILGLSLFAVSLGLQLWLLGCAVLDLEEKETELDIYLNSFSPLSSALRERLSKAIFEGELGSTSCSSSLPVAPCPSLSASGAVGLYIAMSYLCPFGSGEASELLSLSSHAAQPVEEEGQQSQERLRSALEREVQGILSLFYIALAGEEVTQRDRRSNDAALTALAAVRGLETASWRWKETASSLSLPLLPRILSSATETLLSRAWGSFQEMTDSATEPARASLILRGAFHPAALSLLSPSPQQPVLGLSGSFLEIVCVTVERMRREERREEKDERNLSYFLPLCHRVAAGLTRTARQAGSNTVKEEEEELLRAVQRLVVFTFETESLRGLVFPLKVLEALLNGQAEGQWTEREPANLKGEDTGPSLFFPSFHHLLVSATELALFAVGERPSDGETSSVSPARSAASLCLEILLRCISAHPLVFRLSRVEDEVNEKAESEQIDSLRSLRTKLVELLLALSYEGEQAPWGGLSGEKIQRASRTLLECLVNKPSRPSFSQRVRTGAQAKSVEESSTVKAVGSSLSSIFHNLAARLSGEKWKEKENELAKFAFGSWVVSLASKGLRDEEEDFNLLGKVLPLCGPMIDDYTSQTHQLLGIRVLSSALDQVTTTEVRWFAPVISKILEDSLTSRDAAVLSLLLPTIAAFCTKERGLGENPTKNGETLLQGSSSSPFFEKFFSRVLRDMPYQTSQLVKVSVLAGLRPFVIEMGFPRSFLLVKYFGTVLRALDKGNYLRSPQERVREEALETLLLLLKHCWMRIEAHLPHILSSILAGVGVDILLKLPVSSSRETQVQDASQEAEKSRTLCLAEESLLFVDNVVGRDLVETFLLHMREDTKGLEKFIDNVRYRLRAAVRD